ncbi:MAG: LptA/OstA family protein, partial [Acidiferrobacterales bacterium]
MITARFLVAMLLASTFSLSSIPGLAAEKIWHNTNQPVSLKSKSIRVDQKSGVITYRGNVRVKQGNLIIMAAKAKTTSTGTG